MNPTFETIGLEVPSEKAFNYLAERAGDQGEPTQLTRRGAILHGRCWKLGEGLEVWTVLYESGSGDVFYADCRPGFRARYSQSITPWALTEYDEEGEAVVHGYCEGSDCEVLFELQNLTEVGPGGFRAQQLHVGLCGLAYRARVRRSAGRTRWVPLERLEPLRHCARLQTVAQSPFGQRVILDPRRTGTDAPRGAGQPPCPARRGIGDRRHARSGGLVAG